MFKSIGLLVLFTYINLCFVNAQCFELVWSDEFNGQGAPNAANWGYDLGQNGWGNQEVQNYTNSTNNVRQEDGSLIIEARKTSNGWTSARIKSQGKYNFTYGKISFRAKLPAGSGTWPALWMLGENITSIGWPACGEIDVMEHVGKTPGRIHASLHSNSSHGNTQNTATRQLNTFSTEFHEYTAIWTENDITFFIDDVQYYRYAPASKNNNNWPFNTPYFIIMNIAMGGTFGSDPQFETNNQRNGIDPNLTNVRMEVDYVRVYRLLESPTITGPQFVAEQQNNITFSAQDYPGASYNWTVPADAQIVSGQGTRQITVQWGNNDGSVQLAIDGETGCSNNNTTLQVKTTIKPQGLNYLLTGFDNNNIQGWSKVGGTEVTISGQNNQLRVVYAASAMRTVQYEMSKPLDLSDHGILKFNLMVPETAQSLPQLICTLFDGNGNETITSSYELNIDRKDGNYYTYSFDFDPVWNSNSPNVDPKTIRIVRFYLLTGRSEFFIDELYFYNSKTIPSTPQSLQIVADESLNWQDNSNGVRYNIYAAADQNGTYDRVASSIPSKDVPWLIQINPLSAFLKVSAVNSAGESPLSEAVEWVSRIMSTSAELEKWVQCYPNPAKDRLVIQHAGLQVNEIRMYNLHGQQVDLETKLTPDQAEIQLKHPQVGMHTLLLQTSKGLVIKKIIIE